MMNLDIALSYPTAGPSEDPDGVILQNGLHGKSSIRKEEWRLEHIQIMHSAPCTTLA